MDKPNKESVTTKSKTNPAVIIPILMVLLTVLWVYLSNKMPQNGYIPWAQRDVLGKVVFIFDIPLWTAGKLLPEIFHAGARQEANGWVVYLSGLTAMFVYFFAVSYGIYRAIKTLRER